MDASFFPRDCVPIGEGQSPEYNWKMELLSAAVSVVPPEIVPLLLKLHEKGVFEWIKENGFEIAGYASALSLLLTFGYAPLAAAGAAAAIRVVPAVVAPYVAATAAATATAIQAGARLTGLSSGGLLVKACYDKYKEYMYPEKKQQ